jgi:hypothetical protein
MRKLSFFIVLAAASFPLAAQQQQEDRRQTPQGTQDASNSAALERARTEGAAGGTAPVPAEKRKAVGAGAGPHLQDSRPSPQKLPRDQPIAPAR